MSDERPEAVDALRAQARAVQSLIRTLIPGIVVVYNDATQQATIQIARRGADRGGKPYTLPPLLNVPVLWPSWGNTMRIQGFMVPGDEVLLGICDRSIEAFMLKGGVVNAETARMHHLSDAVAFPVSFSAPKVKPPTLGVTTIGRDSAQIQISQDPAPPVVSVRAGQIDLGELASQGAARVGDTVAADAAGVTSMAAWITAVSAATGATPPTNFGVIATGSAVTRIE